jgi:hypothetical protein
MIDRLTETDWPRWAELWCAYLDFYSTVLPPEQYDDTWRSRRWPVRRGRRDRRGCIG